MLSCRRQNKYKNKQNVTNFLEMSNTGTQTVFGLPDTSLRLRYTCFRSLQAGLNISVSIRCRSFFSYSFSIHFLKLEFLLRVRKSKHSVAACAEHQGEIETTLVEGCARLHLTFLLGPEQNLAAYN